MSEPTTTTDSLDWRELAACKGEDTALFFMERGGMTNEMRAYLKALCWSCLVRRACLDCAMSDPFISGWYGATMHRDRRMYGYAKWRERKANQPIADVGSDA